MEITLETVLIVVIVLITLNLLLVGVYIVKVLREALKTIHKAQVVIDDVDESIKDGVEKMKSMEKPLQAMAITSEAVTGVFRNAGAFKRRIIGTSTIVDDGNSAKSITSSDEKGKSKTKKKVRRPKFFKRK